MRSFDDAVRLGVVWRNPNVIDLVAFGKVIEGFDEGGAVVCNNFLKSAPSAEYIFENECA